MIKSPRCSQACWDEIKELQRTNAALLLKLAEINNQPREPSPMTRQEIIDLISQTFDAVPSDWPRHRGWDDNAGDIADTILARFGQPNPEAGKERNALPSLAEAPNPNKLLDKCPACGITPERGLHRFCTRGECPVR
ncbi:hypothetical protein SAMN05216337_1001230 [Bradyrhizobium brasilense]|uniref:Uncharacterized protein n=1 Tax=Bradyrhizobium brasilense TaxID=1419277 RepID=A0A1G6IRF9_9BRAD|nr:hypothetical protein [Bradyrhizobium brasilense]SDC09099.1 hypothetical protein SAMN05216337_1001230 [Bradyrhizobium brasilense]